MKTRKTLWITNKLIADKRKIQTFHAELLNILKSAKKISN
jgi:hypothetical protein